MSALSLFEYMDPTLRSVDFPGLLLSGFLFKFGGSYAKIKITSDCYLKNTDIPFRDVTRVFALALAASDSVR